VPQKPESRKPPVCEKQTGGFVFAARPPQSGIDARWEMVSAWTRASILNALMLEVAAWEIAAITAFCSGKRCF